MYNISVIAPELWPVSDEFYNRGLFPFLHQIKKFASPWDLLDYILEQLHEQVTETIIENNVTISKHSTVVGPVWISENTIIDDFTSIKGPAFIGKNTYIGSNCLIRQSVIGERNLVGFSTEIGRSVIANSCKFHRNSFLDSLACSETSLGGWTGTANVRLDNNKIHGKNKRGTILGMNTRVGAKCEMMPGVLIGTGCVIGPNKTIYSNVSDSSRLMR